MKKLKIKIFIANLLLNKKGKEKYSDKLEEKGIETRICSECGKIMLTGYVIDGGMDYYCSDKCLHKNMNEKEYLEEYGDGDTETYWTEFN